MHLENLAKLHKEAFQVRQAAGEKGSPSGGVAEAQLLAMLRTELDARDERVRRTQ